MNRVYVAIIVMLILGCKDSEKATLDNSLWEFIPQNHQTAFDNACQPLLVNYQDFLKGLVGMDTVYLFNSAKNLAALTDSFPAIENLKDSLLIYTIQQGLVNIHAEIEGLLLETSWPEIYKASNMISLQLIHLLGNAGYQNRTIYIFNTSSDLQEDELHWLGLTKSSRDPYHPNNKEWVLAQQVLQEN